jgi:hypothetical protein
MLIPDGDSVFRHCVYPVAFRKQTLSPEKAIKFYNEPYGFLASVAWEVFVPTPTYIHRYGCRLADSINTNSRVAGSFKEESPKVYCGAYQLSAGVIRALSTIEGLEEIESADVTHHIENKEIAHCDLKIVLKLNNGRDSEGTKTAIVDRLWRSCRGPLTHTCSCDNHISPHPSSYLVTPPAGAFRDRMPPVRRCWCVVRLQVLSLWWRKRINDS